MDNNSFNPENEILQEAERLARALDEFDEKSWSRISAIADSLKGDMSVISEAIAERGAELQSIAQAGAILQNRGKHIGEKPEPEFEENLFDDEADEDEADVDIDVDDEVEADSDDVDTDDGDDAEVDSDDVDTDDGDDGAEVDGDADIDTDEDDADDESDDDDTEAPSVFSRLHFGADKTSSAVAGPVEFDTSMKERLAQRLSGGLKPRPVFNDSRNDEDADDDTFDQPRKSEKRVYRVGGPKHAATNFLDDDLDEVSPPIIDDGLDEEDVQPVEAIDDVLPIEASEDDVQLADTIEDEVQPEVADEEVQLEVSDEEAQPEAGEDDVQPADTNEDLDITAPIVLPDDFAASQDTAELRMDEFMPAQEDTPIEPMVGIVSEQPYTSFDVVADDAPAQESLLEGLQPGQMFAPEYESEQTFATENVAEFEPEAVADFEAQVEPAFEPEPVAEFEAEPAFEPEPEPVAEFEAQPNPMFEFGAALESQAQPFSIPPAAPHVGIDTPPAKPTFSGSDLPEWARHDDAADQQAIDDFFMQDLDTPKGQSKNVFIPRGQTGALPRLDAQGNIVQPDDAFSAMPSIEPEPDFETAFEPEQPFAAEPESEPEPRTIESVLSFAPEQLAPTFNSGVEAEEFAPTLEPAPSDGAPIFEPEQPGFEFQAETTDEAVAADSSVEYIAVDMMDEPAADADIAPQGFEAELVAEPAAEVEFAPDPSTSSDVEQPIADADAPEVDAFGSQSTATIGAGLNPAFIAQFEQAVKAAKEGGAGEGLALNEFIEQAKSMIGDAVPRTEDATVSLNPAEQTAAESAQEAIDNLYAPEEVPEVPAPPAPVPTAPMPTAPIFEPAIAPASTLQEEAAVAPSADVWAEAAPEQPSEQPEEKLSWFQRRKLRKEAEKAAKAQAQVAVPAEVPPAPAAPAPEAFATDATQVAVEGSVPAAEMPVVDAPAAEMPAPDAPAVEVPAAQATPVVDTPQAPGAPVAEAAAETAQGAIQETAAPEPEVFSADEVARFRNIYTSRDGNMALYEDEDGHITAVNLNKLA